MKFQLVDDWKKAWRWFSMNCMVVAAAIQGAWVYVPDDMREAVPHHIVEGITITLLVLGVLGRLVKQGNKEDAGQ